ncbi:MAG: hypothetical protein ABI700_10510 [Chloroflexota bacterium]
MSQSAPQKKETPTRTDTPVSQQNIEEQAPLTDPINGSRDLSPQQILHLQRTIGNQAVMRLIAPKTGVPKPVLTRNAKTSEVPKEDKEQRDLTGDEEARTFDQTPTKLRAEKPVVQREPPAPSTIGINPKIEKALQTQQVGELYGINRSDVDSASEDQRIRLLQMLVKQKNSGYGSLVWIWLNFEAKLPEMVDKYPAEWTFSVEQNPQLAWMEPVKERMNAFSQEVYAVAGVNLQENRLYVKTRMAELGLMKMEGVKPLTGEEKTAYRQNMQKVAYSAAELKQDQKRMLNTLINKPSTVADDGDIQKFNPKAPPNPTEPTYDNWVKLKESWDTTASEVGRLGGQYPEIYEALASDNPEEELLALSRVIPEKFDSRMDDLLGGLLDRISDTRHQLEDEAIDWFDLKGIHEQLLGGSKKISTRRWSEPGLDQWAAKNRLVERQHNKEIAEAVLMTLEIAALLVANFATAGSATFFLAAGVAAGSPAVQGAVNWNEGQKLDQAAKSTPLQGTALVTQAQADSVKAEAVAKMVDAFLTAFLVGAPVVAAIRGEMIASRLGQIAGMTAKEAAPLIEKAIANNISVARVTSESGKTLEDLLEIVGADSAATKAIQAYEKELLAKPLTELTEQEIASSRALQAQRALQEGKETVEQMVARLRKEGHEITVNIGGTGAAHEPANAINLNPNKVAPRKDIPNHVVGSGEDIGALFQPGSADSVVGYGLPPDVLDWNQIAPGSYSTLRSGGKFSVAFRYGSPGEGARLANALKKAGFRDVNAVGDVWVKAVKP